MGTSLLCRVTTGCSLQQGVVWLWLFRKLQWKTSAAYLCLCGGFCCVIPTQNSSCTVIRCLQSPGTGQGTVRFFSKVSRLKLLQEVTFVLQWTFAMAGDISGCDSWGLLPSGWRSRMQLNFLALQDSKVPLTWCMCVVQMLVVSRWRQTAWDWCPHWQVYCCGSLDGTGLTAQMVWSAQEWICTLPSLRSLLPACRFAVEKYFSVLVRGTWKEARGTCSNLGELARVPVSQAGGVAF